ncbi:MAG: HAMP domain-containing sensor histidine kinase [Bryobacteraceae bacterium]
MTGWRLSRKAAALGVLNLALAALAVLIFGRLQYGLGAESLLTGPARDRIMAAGNAFSLELNNGADPEETLAHYGHRFNSRAYLTNPGGDAIYGPRPTLPQPVLNRMSREGSGPPPRRPFFDFWGPPLRRKSGPPPKNGRPKGGPQEPFFFEVTRNPTAYWTVIRIPVETPAGRVPGMLVFQSDSLLGSTAFFDWLPWLMLTLAIVGLSILCWLPFVRGLTRAIGEMDRVTERIAQGHFDSRVSDTRSDELGHLGSQVNRLAARLQDFVRNQKRFLGDTAHELAAPIARVQFALGILEQRLAGHAVDSSLAALREEIQEMSELVSELLSFSKAGMEPQPATRDRVNLADIARKAAAREGVYAAIEIAGDLHALADPRLLMRAIGNLLRNAARYAGDIGAITVAAKREQGFVILTVSDEGPGLPPDALDQVFEPFYRPQESRSRDTGGVGLGLAIVKSCVEACGGAVTCRNRKPRGLEVAIRLEAAALS